MLSPPGMTVPFLPSEFKDSRATKPGAAAELMTMFARAAKPLRTGPGAEARTSTPLGFSSIRSASANDCTRLQVSAYKLIEVLSGTEQTMLWRAHSRSTPSIGRIKVNAVPLAPGLVLLRTCMLPRCRAKNDPLGQIAIGTLLEQPLRSWNHEVHPKYLPQTRGRSSSLT